VADPDAVALPASADLDLIRLARVLHAGGREAAVTAGIAILARRLRRDPGQLAGVVAGLAAQMLPVEELPPLEDMPAGSWLSPEDWSGA
jgi:hypothetical protein